MDVQVGMGKRKVKNPSIPIRQCANIKSKKHPDTRCPLAAAQGEFCSRHTKNPTRFQQTSLFTVQASISTTSAAKKVQRMWRTFCPLLRFRKQGPAATDTSLAENQTDVYTLESTSTIPLIYRWSYADTSKHIWIFDIRSLSMMRSQEAGNLFQNPYTRDEISEKAHTSFLQRCTQLRAQKYCLVHSSQEEMTEEQLWHQKLLDVSMKYDALGYSLSLQWYEELTIQSLYSFYYELWELWMYRLQLPGSLKFQVVPTWSSAEAPLFRWIPVELRNRRDIKWWKTIILEILNRLVSAPSKEHRSLGALYGITAFAIISPKVRQQYPWLVEMPGDPGF